MLAGSGRGESQVRTRADSIAADSLARARADSLQRARRDSLRTDSLRREDLAIVEAQRRLADSVKTPTPTAESPPVLESDGSLIWNRQSLFATGALTLGDLLEGVPGVTVLRSGWIGSPEQASMLADFGSIRVFLDGIELEALDPRNRGTIDLATIQLWPLEDVRLERGAGELRIHLRTWRENNTTPRTRVDVATGDLETNSYRGYFGRRFQSGYAIQAGGFQYTTREPTRIGDADQLSLFSRFGWAKGRFGADAAFLRTSRERTAQPRLEESGRPDMRALDATFTDLYLRGEFRDTTSGLWAQLIAAQLSHRQSERLESDEALPDTTTDSTAFSASRSQYIAAGGMSRGPWSLSATARVRESAGAHRLTTTLRAGWETGAIRTAIIAEDRRRSDSRFLEATVRLSPPQLRSIVLAASASTIQRGTTSAAAGGIAWRGEAALRLGRMWVVGGITSRDTLASNAPVVFDTGFANTSAGRVMGTYARLSGKFWRDVGLDVSAIRWDSAGGPAYLPRHSARSRLYLDTDMRNRYPSGNLAILFAVQHEYRSSASFPIIDGGPVLRSSEYRALGLLLEIRLLKAATLTYQFRNLLNEDYEQVPGFRSVRPVQYYGVRWNFFN
ncbi:MAG: TonB-dependent receptor [Gemmatimonadota bacterium]